MCHYTHIHNIYNCVMYRANLYSSIDLSLLPQGILVQKIVQRSGGNRCSGLLSAAAPGATLCVTLSVTSPDDLQDVQVLDLVASGLEPIEEEEEEELFSFRPPGA